jgi:hypothetical protein
VNSLSIDITSTSIIFSFIKALNNIFKSSKTYKLLATFGGFYKYSNINSLIQRYLNRNSSLPKSVVYKLCSTGFRLIDRLWDRLYNFLANCCSSSTVIQFLVNSFSGEESFSSFSLLILFFSIGYAVAAYFSGSFGTVSALLSILGVIASLILMPGKARWRKCLNNSLSWKFFLYIFD